MSPELDILITHPAPERFQKARLRPAGYATLIVVAIIVLGCATYGSAGAEKGLLDDAEQRDFGMLVLGESSADNPDCSTCSTYIEQFAAVVAREEGRSVQIYGAGGDPTTWPLTDLTAVTALLQNDSQLRELVRTADIVLIRLGDEDSTAAFDVGSCVADQVVRSPCTMTRNGPSSQQDLLLTAIEDLRPDAMVVLLMN